MGAKTLCLPTSKIIIVQRKATTCTCCVWGVCLAIIRVVSVQRAAISAECKFFWLESTVGIIHNVPNRMCQSDPLKMRSSFPMRPPDPVGIQMIAVPSSGKLQYLVDGLDVSPWDLMLDAPCVDGRNPIVLVKEQDGRTRN
jgi:hypothetical protein